ncbi:MAG: site-2 protease family protein [Oscillospiraceae bacterium]
MLYIVIAILMFGVLIAIHEFGHFATAKALGVRVNEFAIGMGPKILSKQGAETLYSWRLFPIGGYCAMEGEDEDTEDPRSFQKAKGWKKLLILVAGSATNFLAGLLIFLVLFSQTASFVTPTIGGFLPGFTGGGEGGIMVGDTITRVDGHKILLFSDLNLFLSRADDTLDLELERDGRKIVLKDYEMPAQEYTQPDGTVQLKRGIVPARQDATVLDRLKLSWYNTLDTVRMVWIGLSDLVTGAVGLRDMSGVIGIVDMIGQVGEQSANTGVAVWNIFSFIAFIAVNLAVMNLLPIPALDGGRIFFLAVNGLFTLFTRKKLDPKYENYVNGAGFIALLALMAIVAVSDVLKLVGV